MNRLEKLRNVSVIISAVFIPILLAIIGNQYTKAIKKSELELRFVELGVQILSQAPTEKNRNLREWALQIIDLYSEVPMSKSTRKDLVEKIPLAKMEVFHRSFDDEETFQFYMKKGVDEYNNNDPEAIYSFRKALDIRPNDMESKEKLEASKKKFIKEN